ncbi:MAG: hypothetical protein CMB53_02900 [Euryarchaeota archaeon]|nr:hypothetical protein [Euryarchaeota archaeon]|tara:strand:+ start:17972 stop:18271 length:300 start_codon:yes stop_codon:yes gene_type:complete
MRSLPVDWDEKGRVLPRPVGDVVAEFVWTGSRDRAELLLASIEPDDKEFFEGEVLEIQDGAELRIRVSSDTLSKARSTMDDILACLSAVEASLAALDGE